MAHVNPGAKKGPTGAGPELSGLSIGVLDPYRIARKCRSLRSATQPNSVVSPQASRGIDVYPSLPGNGGGATFRRRAPYHSARQAGDGYGQAARMAAWIGASWPCCFTRRLAVEKTLFPRRWYGGMISANLEVIWKMSVWSNGSLTDSRLKSDPHP